VTRPGWARARTLAQSLLVALAVLPAAAAQGAPATPRPADRAVYVDREGVVRWRDDRREVALFGANYVLPTASDYRAAGYLHLDRKQMIVEDMAHFARMGWDGIRLTFWGDWEAADSAGNLIANDHLDLFDWLIARARERGVYMLFSPIQLYNAKWPDAMADTTAPGFGRRYPRDRMGLDSAAISAQVTYLRQILDHVNPYTGVALKDEPAILFIELVNEPVHHPEDLAGSIRYIDRLTAAVRSTGCTKLVFYNVSQDFAIGEAIRRSKVQGITFGWYPSGLNSGHELPGNFLRSVDDFPDMRRPELARLPRIVYEFDTPDLRDPTLYPAMARTFRSVGTQFAAMFAYDMLGTASRNLAWQTHYLNLVYTPTKAMSSVIAAEAMRRLPRGKTYGPYPENTRFGDFRVSYEEGLAELVATDAFLYAGSTRSSPPDPGALTRIAGVGSSPVVQYTGLGSYFLDNVRPGLWRLEVYPDAVPVRDPFEPPSASKIVTRALARPWPMTVTLPDLGGEFAVQSLTEVSRSASAAAAGRFTVTPGVYLLSASGSVDPASLPSFVGRVGLAEFHAPPADFAPPAVLSLAGRGYAAGQDAEIRARVVADTRPDSVALYLRPRGRSWYQAFPMRPAGGDEYLVAVPGESLQEGPYEYFTTISLEGAALTFPGAVLGRPTDWNWNPSATWSFAVAGAETPLRLFDPASDVERLAWSRVGDGGRTGRFRVALSGLSGQPVLRFALPDDGQGGLVPDYTASLVIRDRIRARQGGAPSGSALRLRARGLGGRQFIHLTLMEEDGTSWTGAVAVDTAWSEQVLRLDELRVGQGVLLPQGFPGTWSYWVGPAAGRGGSGDHPRLDRVERLQLSLRRGEGVTTPGGGGVEVEWVALTAEPAQQEGCR